MPQSEPIWIGYVVSGCLVLITFLLGLTAWLLQRQWNVQTETNNHFRETFERMWTTIGGKVSDATCKEREGVMKCGIDALASDFKAHTVDFKAHSHTELSKESELVVRSKA